ncbi:hypothetical protein ACIKTA_17750 [Hansschlegelia beijingensis]
MVRMKRLVLGALLAIFAAQMLAFAPEAGAQDYYRRYQEAPPPSERSARQRRYVDEDDAYFQRRMQYYRRDQVTRRQQEARRTTEAARPRSVFPIPPELFRTTRHIPTRYSPVCHCLRRDRSTCMC